MTTPEHDPACNAATRLSRVASARARAEVLPAGGPERSEILRHHMTRIEWRSRGYRVPRGARPTYVERYRVPMYSSVYRHYFSHDQVVPLRSTVATVLAGIEAAI
jgi:hypothetical protein